MSSEQHAWGLTQGRRDARGRRVKDELDASVAKPFDRLRINSTTQPNLRIG
jgi:hypothetical protein